MSITISRKTYRLVKKSSLIVTLWLLGVFFANTLYPLGATQSFNESEISVWWPTINAPLSGTQTLKALVENKPLNEYDMYWQVDGGNLVKMEDSLTDYPHKEAIIEVGGWNWNSEGKYLITFLAKDLGGNTVGETAVPIIISNTTSGISAISPTLNTTVEVPNLQEIQPSSKIQISTPSGTPSVDVWWPKQEIAVAGLQPLKAVVPGRDLSTYNMYWTVDGSTKTGMVDSYSEGPHKEISVDFSSWNWEVDQNYTIYFIATDNSGNVIASKAVSVTVSAFPQANTATKETTQKSEPTLTNVLVGENKLYVNPYSPALAQAEKWSILRPLDAAIMKKIGNQSVGVWYGNWNADVRADVEKVVKDAKSKNSIPTLVSYNIPFRDCNGYSGGGLSSSKSYLEWIKQFSAGIGQEKAIIVLEPDALALVDCLTPSAQNERFQMLQNATAILKQNTNAKIYLDAGHANWISPDTMSSRLLKSGVKNINGFSLNVSNFEPTADNIEYGRMLSKKIGVDTHFVIDTSRNGLGSNGEWCNPSGRALGQMPTLSTGHSLVDAFLWIKPVGESDGNCNGGPNAGAWWADYALDMAKRAGY